MTTLMPYFTCMFCPSFHKFLRDHFAWKKRMYSEVE